MKRPTLTPVVSLLALLISIGAHAQPADLVIENARIWSDGRDDLAPFAAIRDGRFVHVGRRDDSLIGPDTTILDAAGRVVIPGLIDSHVHLLSGGASLSAIQLRDATSKQDFIRRVADWADTLQPGQWILGGRYSTESWASREQPTKDWLDLVTGDHPAWLSRMDGHSGLANSIALALAGITREGPTDPEGGVIDRDPTTNEPTGILRESAMGLVTRHIPPTAEQDRAQNLKRAMHHANANGITAVTELPGGASLSVYESLADAGQLTCRLYLYPAARDDALLSIRRFRAVPHWLQINGIKSYMDGSLGSRTAYMREPFLNNEPSRPDWRGLLADGVADGTFIANAYAARDADLQIIAHAIGDQANHYLIETLDAVYADALPDARCRSEHAQHLLPGDIERFATLGVIASMQPFHKADDGRYAEEYIGEARCRSSYAYRSLLDAGVVLCFGSDWPVVTINPFLGIEAAVTGRTLDGKLWQTQENITVEEALRCYTSTAAYAMFAENEIGRIAPGYRADFVILNASPFDPDPDFSAMAPVATYIEGRLVYDGLR
ncbi:MAG: amidohydrolase [Planctomycetes bacterium]|nr:amidohydrolase [Planctomycetota bacterium]